MVLLKTVKIAKKVYPSKPFHIYDMISLAITRKSFNWIV